MNSIAESLRGHLLTGDLLLSSVIKHFLSCLGADDIWEPSSEEETPRTMVAIFDYNPAESSPNADTEVTKGALHSIFSDLKRQRRGA